MAVADPDNILEEHHHHDPFIAHHFDNAEQQFDSGKFGIWIFLVTEVLFFSGLFVAYTLYRIHHPEIFDQAHHFLDKNLGAMNTIVLLFSSLTMALGVHSAQNGDNKKCAIYTLITMVCAAMFLGVKAVEYSHKWDMGIFVRSAFNYSDHHAEGISSYLIYISAIPALLLVGFIGASLMAKMTEKDLFSKFCGGMAVTVGGYFLGVFVGLGFMALTAKDGGHANREITTSPLVLQALTVDEEEQAEGDDHDHGDEHADEDHAHADDHAAHDDPNKDPMDRDIGIFFSIYYCMTGLHAIHIIAGIMALAWVFWRSLSLHWRPDYFGPVDYVGLYWHLVDLIWIYLFPLLYLID
ncbi:cytochrome c oxidase subunit 3 [Mariniblastus fucicola]|uniref:Quinol oxidase subunit 3 n=1 Tax=Mariniblastus fucicola TaxID=980251 RepID=A0A5B9P1S9_9BACT|nr:cytochrome c oxidase subunit 3 [Mariniblastus fucicola]QEG20268.1 Quinol oxidase subunit 3 [Mariniblastus fucicola]